jgi:glycolate oxidase iron-sulfur subunit
MAGDPPARSGYAALDPCVHCGFCLPACPTYLATGDESDSPRGRIVLMRALERGELAADDPALVEHLDACLGCRGCEPVCPSGVGYGRGLEAAREQIARTTGLGARARAILAVFRQTMLWRPIFTLARALRGTGLPARLAGESDAAFTFGMLAATTPLRPSAVPPLRPAAHPRGTVAIFRGCVMDSLFRHVHDATRRTLAANGYRVVEVPGQVCCGALHEHAGDRADAEALARRNIAAFADDADFIVVNSAGCGALLKDYGHLLGEDRGAAFAARVRDVSELLAAAGPRVGGPLPLDVAYDAPCHLQHAQGVHAEPLAVLAAIPELRLRLLPGHDKCCGSAGIYSMLHPAMARSVLELKVAELAAALPRPSLVTTGNPGCLMQIGAGLRAAELPIGVAHPVELLDWSYQAGGLYRGD